MARKKQAKKKEISQKQKRKLLKEHGFIKGDLRKNPTKQQQKTIEKNWRNYGDLVGGDYAVRKIKSDRTKQFKELGYFVKGDKVYINKEGYTNVYIGKDHITKKKGRKKQTDLLLDASKVPQEIENYFNKKYTAKNNKKNKASKEYLTAKIGDNAHFAKPAFTYEDLLAYIANFKPQRTLADQAAYKRGSEKTKAKIDKKYEALQRDLIAQISIVEIKDK